MRDVRLLLVLVMALGIIVIGGVAIPMLLSALAPSSVAVARPEALADAEKIEPLPPVPEGLDILSERFRAVAKRIRPSVVAIGVSQTVEGSPLPFDSEFFRRFFGERGGGPGRGQQFQRRGLGSGVIVSADGYILTNNHVVADADEITVRLHDGREFPAKVIGTDPPSEIAVIRIQAKNLTVAALGDNQTMEVGDWVLAVGAPFGLDQTVTSGIISATGRYGVGITEYENFIQTDAAINPGNSGGPLVNMRGEVIGINTAIASRSGGYMGIGFAVPMNMAREVMKRLVEEGEVIRGWLGVSIQPLTEDMAESMGIEAGKGVLISQVFDGGPAAEAGIRAGDVILKVGDKETNDPNTLQSAVAWTKPGTKADVVLLRGGKRRTLAVTVTQRSEQPQVAAVRPGKPAALDELGIDVSAVTPQAREQFGYDVGQGVLITKVEGGGLADRAGLEPGMLILQAANQDVASVAELQKVLKDADLARGLPLLVRAGDRQMFVLIKKR
ncbi:MAG: DegQ family serine endoprotease [Planctomycetes bacterium]|nr:DegQ family serine endoprotease [Planctomycetota bacterium]